MREPTSDPISAKRDAAWKSYFDELNRIRDELYRHPYAASIEGRAGADYLIQQIQAAAFNVTFGPNQASPRFFGNLLFDPGVYSWTSPGADYLYRKAFVDGRGTYRITGKRRNSALFTFQIMAAYWNEPPEEMRNIGNYAFDSFAVGEDGTFEIIASAEPHSGNWIKLEESRPNICIMTREAFNDWEGEERSDLYIETIISVESSPFLSEDEYVRRLEGMKRFINYTTANFSHTLVQNAADRGGVNSFVVAGLFNPKLKDTGVNPIAGFDMMKFELEQGQALLIEIESIDSPQWTLQTSDVWHQNRNFVDHQSSLNGFQAKPDSDGVIRIVLSIEDPGVPNWLDTVGLQNGSIDFRYLLAPSRPVAPCSLLPLAELKDRLPDETPVVTDEMRQDQLGRRRRAIMRLWGHV